MQAIYHLFLIKRLYTECTKIFLLLDWKERSIGFYRRRAAYRWPVRHNPPSIHGSKPAAGFPHLTSTVTHVGAGGCCCRHSLRPSVLDARPATLKDRQLLSAEEPKRHKAAFIHIVPTPNFTWGWLNHEQETVVYYYWWIVYCIVIE